MTTLGLFCVDALLENMTFHDLHNFSTCEEMMFLYVFILWICLGLRSFWILFMNEITYLFWDIFERSDKWGFYKFWGIFKSKLLLFYSWRYRNVTIKIHQNVIKVLFNTKKHKFCKISLIYPNISKIKVHSQTAANFPSWKFL